MNFSVVENENSKAVFGLCQKSNDRTQARDIPALSKRFHKAVGMGRGEVIPFFVISKDYDERTKDFQLFVGGLLENDNLKAFIIPKGLYGKVTVKPKLGFLWGPAIGEAKRRFYMEWLPKSGYSSRCMEYEYHAEASIGRTPQIDILFAIEKRAE